MLLKKTNLLTVLCLMIFIWSGNTQNKPLDIKYKRNSDNSVSFSFTKKNPGSTYVILKFNQLTNASTNVIRRTIYGFSGNITTLKPIDPKKGIGFSYSYTFIDGDSRAKPELDFKYILPFKNDKKIAVRKLSYLGEKFGNTNPKNWTSFQFLTEPNDTVYAARKGVVVKIVDEFNPDLVVEYNFKNESNYIVVEHEDGTFARYGVLKKNSIMVKIGRKVYPLTPLAITGSYDKPENSQLRFSVYYLDDDITELNNSKSNLTNQKHYYVFVNPVFYNGENGSATKLIANNDYIAYCNNNIIEVEMTKREKKKRLKK
ncbi:M23 family metallopeptidase [Flaviramulus sp. BrNp1-15]|uniref:M23 family metallopeptidase n=1 Tax=Flaviramulus sp. BrNp1-15 TaxID=2916754 RepID=UPI001EE8A57A|nr:M23 family metallopeptidase [Flaviramulus sp. BrNp1-15]ULC59367.1 M23 family metallopeptidase [Flaviramulus sp. BrNp1-15]